jgi:outer membrane protein insertion porin family
MENKSAKVNDKKPDFGRHLLFFFLFPFFLFPFSFLLGGCASTSKRSAAAIEQAAKTGKEVVKSVDFKNNRTFNDKTLQKQVGFKLGDYLDPILAESGRRSLAEFYRGKGFPNTRVEADTSALPQGKVTYTINEGERLRIKSVRFRGNSVIKTSDLKKVVKTGTRDWLFRPVYYTEEKITADVERLRNIYYRRGFLNHSIRTEGPPHLVFIIEEGPRYKIGKIIVTGNKFFDTAAIERLRAGLKLEPGRIYNQRSANSYAAAILKLYRENGFVDADVDQRVIFGPSEGGPAQDGSQPARTLINGIGVVDVEYSITEGNQFRIGQVEISGNEITQDRVIRRILDEYGLTPGLLYNADIAPTEGGGRMERDLQRMLLAEQTIIRPVSPPDGATDHRDLRVDVKEGLTGMWSPGVAIGSDSGVMGRLIFQQRNFDITDWPESFGEFITMQSFKGAGQTLRVALEPGTEVSEYSIAFTEPYFRDRPTSMDVVGSSYIRGRESYNENRLRSYLGFEQRLKERWRRGISFRLENVDVTGVDSDAPKEIKDVEGGNMMAGVRVSFGRDLTDDRFNPSRGYTFDTGYEQVGGDHTFGILKGVFVRYWTLYEDLLERKTVLATKMLGATTVSEAPPFEKFYAGGTSQYGLRGFKYRGVSTRGWQTGVATPSRKDPIGSDWIFLANAEVTMPLVGENFFALFFIDSGTIDTGGYRASIGTGIQILLPQWFGPVPMRFEIAKPFMKDDQDETRTFSFSLGGLLF